MSTFKLRRKGAMRLHLFDPYILKSRQDIANALKEFEDIVNEANFVPILEDLLEQEQPLVIELILSGVSEAKPLTSWIIKRFPVSPESLDGSFASKLVSRLSVFFLFHPLPLSGGLSDFVTSSDRHRLVSTASKALSILSAMIFKDQEEREVRARSKYRGKYQKVSKQESQRTTKNLVDLKVLEDHLISVPSSQSDADSAMLTVLHYVKTSLECYFEALRLPAVAEEIQVDFIPREERLSLSKAETNSADATSEEPLRIEIPSAYPMVQPLKSAQHFGSVEGFGEWRVLISTPADQDLREARRKDSKTFKIIVKKIKELSNGHFSDDNQKRLTSQATNVPVFEAKMTGDSRLVYQIDSVSDYDSDREQQVIRIFGVYTHAQVNNRLWDSVGRHLGKRGKEYRRRCLYRKRPVNRGDNVFLPASFPPLEEIETLPSGIGSDLPPDDLDQIHSLLVLGKYLTFSQELLKSIIADLDVAFPFQVSPQEKEIIEYPHSCYVLGRSGTGKTTTMLFKMLWIERAFQLNSDNMPKPRQVFVTKSRVLAGKVEEYFLKLLDSLKTSSQSPQELQKVIKARKTQLVEDNLVDLDDEDHWRGDLPCRFSDLLDSHFPLFITFERMCDLIEADFDPCDRIQYTKESLGSHGFVTYEHFLDQYWPHFSQSLTKGLNPALVFSEIIGIILGSEETTTSALGYLDRITYENLSERTQSAFASHRSVIYSIFEMYQAQKHRRGDFDAGDRTHSILRALAKHGVPGRKIDQLYVDEAQDNLLVDALLLRYLCHNADGLFWAGDTAQTISVGSSFRFNDLKAFLFRIEKRRIERQSAADIPFHAQNSPKTFQLATNYRSHAGIVNCAHSVIELITRFWPNSIDLLAPERGIVEGLKPVFLEGWDSSNVRYEQFLFGSSGSHIEFGAQQCILVRNEGARQKLQEQVGDIGLIMTLYESKGLEFNDVLLFNFFEDSTVDLSQWRIILSAIGSAADLTIAAPLFNETRHAGVCAELKFLYVAITRARKNLWIADQSAKGEPMRTFWTARDQVHNCTPDTDMPRLAVSSSPEEWATKGKELFERKRFLQAKHCYERASMPREMAISHAYFLREQARKEPSGESRRLKEQRHGAFRKAAEAFYSCAQETSKHRAVYFRRAGECFESCAEDLCAANAYLEARDFDIAAKLFRKLGLFDEAIAVIAENKEHMQREVVESITHVARLHYFKREDFSRASELFSGEEEELEYLELLDLDVARAKVLDSLGRVIEAAELHLSEGRTMEAIPLLLKDKNDQQSMRLACSSILQEFWRVLSFGTVPILDQSVSLLLKWSSSLNMELLESRVRDEISMFIAILSDQKLELARLGETFFRAQSFPSAILCLDHYFMRFPSTKMMPVQELGKMLQLFLDYVRLLHELAFKVDPLTTASVAKMFGFRRSSGDDFIIPIDTFLYRNLVKTNFPSARHSSLGEISISGWDLSRTLRRAICDHIRQRISEENEVVQRSPQFSPCLTFIAFGYCNRIECPNEHTHSSLLTNDWYNARIRVHLQQMLILQTLFHSVNSVSDVRSQKRHWVNRFYEALKPAFHVLGTQVNLRVSLIPEFQRGLQVLKDWIRELAYTLDFGMQPRFLAHLIRGAILGYIFDKQEASGYISRSRCMVPPIPPQYLRTPGGEYMLPELLLFLEGNKDTSISAGVLSLRHILSEALPINVSVLCDLVEFLCTSIVVSYTLWANNGSFHGITLPRSWLQRHMKEPGLNEPKDTHLLRLLVEPLGHLLEVIYTGVGAGFLHYDNSDLSMIRTRRNGGIFIARICRALCLLGYNIRQVSLRTAILQAITSLWRIDRTFPNLYKHYILARRWGDLTRTLRKPIHGSLLQDGLVQLHDMQRGPVPSRSMYGVRLITYETGEDLPCIIQGLSPSEVFSSTSAPDVLPKDSEPMAKIDATKVSENDTAEEPDDEVQLTSEAGGIEDVDTGVEMMEPAEFSDMKLSIEPDIPQVHAPSEAELRAVSVIQKTYRRSLLRRRKTAKARLPAARSRFFDMCLERAQNMVWKQNSHYRPLFLGPLPHILLCLDIAQATAFTEKAAVKKHLRSSRHEELEDLSLRLTSLGKAHKSILHLQKALEPTAAVHVNCDHGELRCRVQEAAELLRNLPFVIHEDFRVDLDIAVRGIVVRRQSKANLKPALVWDEDV
ncbi:TPR and ankyrin repeat-containing protein 1 [Hypsizygus marmoreus]|uniref:TPR and ankyrin repeat-containing protein 1 n=1 Tax=Hypsizygus marmoreus TaxID=39966 RepID=A0A369K519_HYPMA|nr:TPR and ankyrin repeat-containing protein 1 [Hypsizygus marmoreus]